MSLDQSIVVRPKSISEAIERINDAFPDGSFEAPQRGGLDEVEEGEATQWRNPEAIPNEET